MIITLDTNFVTPKILHGGRKLKEANLLDYMIHLQDKGLIQISLSQPIQLEIYATLRAGRYKIKLPNGDKIRPKFSHHDIMLRVHRYPEIFDADFLDGFFDIDFKEGKEYKKVLFKHIRDIMNMDINQSKEYLENHRVNLDGCKDEYDFFIMVEAIRNQANYLVTNNEDDFPKKIVDCDVILEKQLRYLLPIYP